MSDQCKFCDIRGKDRTRCTQPTNSGYICSIPESWYAAKMVTENKALIERCKELEKWAAEHGLMILDKKEFWGEISGSKEDR